ncbi:MAG: hypothetical protein AAF570_02905 [Bacteroidota bacterium]
MKSAALKFVLPLLMFAFAACSSPSTSSHSNADSTRVFAPELTIDSVATESNSKYCDPKDWFARDTTKPVLAGRNAAYGYKFCYPKGWKEDLVEVRDERDFIMSDTTYYWSPEGEAVMIEWLGENHFVSQQDTPWMEVRRKVSVKALEKRWAEIKADSAHRLGKVKVRELCMGDKGRRLTCWAEQGDQTVLYVIATPEVPVSGDLQEVVTLFRFPTDKLDEYAWAAELILDCFHAAFY